MMLRQADVNAAIGDGIVDMVGQYAVVCGESSLCSKVCLTCRTVHRTITFAGKNGGCHNRIIRNVDEKRPLLHKILLLPLSKIYGMVTSVRNKMFDLGF